MPTIRLPYSSLMNNAQVPGSAPFLPAQAFVDNIVQLACPSDAFSVNPVFTFTGITNVSLDPDLSGAVILMEAITAIDPQLTFSACTFDFSACSLVVVSVNGVLRMLSTTSVNDPTKWTVILTGGNATPTGQGLTDKADLITAGWHLTTN